MRTEHRNPFRPCGTFTLRDQAATLEKMIDDKRAALQRFVSQRRMKPENFAATMGALETTLHDLKERIEIEDAGQSLEEIIAAGGPRTKPS